MIVKVTFNGLGTTLSALLLAALVGCQEPKDETPVSPPTVYEFTSRSTEGSSVDTRGQIFRHVLLNDLGTRVEGLTSRINEGYVAVSGEVDEDLSFYLDFDGTIAGELRHTTLTLPAALQTTYGSFGVMKDLTGKIAGNDPAGQHVDWNTGFRGFADATSPEALVRQWIAEIDTAAVAWSEGTIPTGPSASSVPAIHVTADGRDLAQLIEKFLLGAVAFSQATDDYLDDDLPGNGLLADNTAAEAGKPYTGLEHAWDEAFGYFGAAKDYGTWTDAQRADPGYRDTFAADGAIDLLSEHSFGGAVSAAKRDLGAVTPTDFTDEAWTAFIEGRTLITAAGGALDEAQFERLQDVRDRAVRAWERAIAASAVHYANKVLRDMAVFGQDSYSFGAHAKHWSELKGFALSFQFNPRSPMSDADFDALHEAIGDRPVLPDANPTAIAAYRDALIDARTLLATTYDFSPENTGNEDGNNGW